MSDDDEKIIEKSELNTAAENYADLDNLRPCDKMPKDDADSGKSCTDVNVHDSKMICLCSSASSHSKEAAQKSGAVMEEAQSVPVLQEKELSFYDYNCKHDPQCYIKAKQIQMLLEFFLAHIVVEMPDNPTRFLLEIVDKLISFRKGEKEPPRLYERKHIKALVHSFDPGDTGFVSKVAWIKAFTTVGLSPPELLPDILSTKTLRQLLLANLDDQIYNLITTTCTCNDRKPSISIKTGDSYRQF